MTALSIFMLSICASFIQRTIGFGFGIFIMTMLPFLMPSYCEATALSGLLALTTAMITVIRMHRYITWKRQIPILTAFIIVSVAAVSILSKMEDQLLRKILGVVLVAISLYFAFFSRRVKLRPTLPMQIGAGTVSGLMGGFFGMQGPPAVLYFIASEPDKEHYIAMTQCYFFIGNMAMTLARAGNGFVTAPVGIGYLYGLAGVLAGTALGTLAFRHISGNFLRYLVYAYIGLSGIVTFITAS